MIFAPLSRKAVQAETYSVQRPPCGPCLRISCPYSGTVQDATSSSKSGHRFSDYRFLFVVSVCGAPALTALAGSAVQPCKTSGRFGRKAKKEPCCMQIHQRKNNPSRALADKNHLSTLCLLP